MRVHRALRGSICQGPEQHYQGTALPGTTPGPLRYRVVRYQPMRHVLRISRRASSSVRSGARRGLDELSRDLWFRV